MVKRIFISRKLDLNSPFHDLKPQGIEVLDHSLIEFKALHFHLPDKQYDNLFFYSKKGISYFFNSQSYNPSICYGVMGEASALFFKTITGFDPDFIGQGNPKEIAGSFLTKMKGGSILFIKAKNSVSSIQNHLSDDVETEDLEVYSNKAKTTIKLVQCDVLIFTSPLNVKTYYALFQDKNEMVMAIGPTTAAAVQECINRKALIPETASEQALYNLVKSRLKL